MKHEMTIVTRETRKQLFLLVEDSTESSLTKLGPKSSRVMQRSIFILKMEFPGKAKISNIHFQ